MPTSQATIAADITAADIAVMPDAYSPRSDRPLPTEDLRPSVARWTSDETIPTMDTAALYGEPKIIDYLPLMGSTIPRSTPETVRSVSALLRDLKATYDNLAAQNKEA